MTPRICTGSSRRGRSCPSYYERDADGPAQGLRMTKVMRRAMASGLWRFSSTRMLHEYTESPLPADGRRRVARHGRPARRHRGRLTTLPPRISLALVLHNHQPVGNFGHVIAQNHDTAYRPLVEALEQHPGVRQSGFTTRVPCWSWLRAERPELIERLSGPESTHGIRSRS